MSIQDLMTQTVHTCNPGDSLHRAAQLMWEHDVGVLPVVDTDGRVVGMITDRDVCMAAYTRGGALADHPVSVAMSRRVHACSASDTVATAEDIMQHYQVRRLPVIKGGRLVGIISLNDLALAAKRKKKNGASAQDVAQTLASICEHRASTGYAAAE
jgi:CBS domain-containing protein